MMPADPSNLEQLQADGATAMSVGGTTTQTTVILRARVVDPENDMCHLMVEVQPVGTPFTNGSTAAGLYVSSGATAEVVLTGLAAGDYHWQVMAMDMNGAMSGWVAFGGNSESLPDFTVSPTGGNNNPDVPTGADQLKLDGVTSIAENGTTLELGVIVSAGLSDADGGVVRLIAELAPIATAFTGTATHRGAFVASGSTATISITGLAANTDYHWRFAAEDANGGVSAWTSFGLNADGSRDFRAATTGNVVPDIATGLDQSLPGGGSVGIGGSFTGDTLLFKGTVTDANGTPVTLQVEIRPVGLPFTGLPTHASNPTASGAEASISVSGLSGGHHWQFRTIDSCGAASAWTSFGGNAETVADFIAAIVAATGGGSSRGCGASEGAGSPLTLVALGLALAWLVRRK